MVDVKESMNIHFANLVNNPLLYTFINSIHDAVIITDREGVVKYVNDAYTRITSVTYSQIVGNKLVDVRKGARLPEVLSTGKPLHGVRRKERNIEYIADIDPVYSNGEVIGAIAILRDITELEQLSRKLLAFSSKVEKFKKRVRDAHRARYTLDDIIGRSEQIEGVKSVVQRIRNSDVAVLIRGESGTGKELFAHTIHRLSDRKDNPFVAINCAAFPSNLLLSELFGYEEGAFTGASKGGKLGLFEVADEGSLFLDEIGDMDFELQSKILRVLETGEFHRVGGTKPIKVNVRIISATNKDLDQLIQQKLFREDLLYRLNVITIAIPPLRERKDDIELLTKHFLLRISRKIGKDINVSPEVFHLLRSHSFPGNVRELLNIVEFSASICDSKEVQPDHLPIVVHSKASKGDQRLDDAVRTTELDAILKALDRSGMTVQGKEQAARELGISLSSLYNKMKQYGIKKQVTATKS